jgi:hypothetical protein
MSVLFPFIFGFVRTKQDVKDKLWVPPERIRCPRCQWEPADEDRWSCNPGGCGHAWNTFITRGRCPSCDQRWAETACLRCHQWSPHDEWYVAI